MKYWLTRDGIGGYEFWCKEPRLSGDVWLGEPLTTSGLVAGAAYVPLFQPDLKIDGVGIIPLTLIDGRLERDNG